MNLFGDFMRLGDRWAAELFGLTRPQGVSIITVAAHCYPQEIPCSATPSIVLHVMNPVYQRV
jgi:hypothetical protein